MSLAITNAVITINDARVDLSHKPMDADVGEQQTKLDMNLRNKSSFAQDLLMFAEGTLFATDIVGIKGDLKLVSGLYNFAQAITHRIMTTRGTMPGNPSFGVPWDTYIGKVYSNANALSSNLIQDITDEIYKDTRTQTVTYVRLNFLDPTIIAVDCAVVPISNSDQTIGISVSVAGTE